MTTDARPLHALLDALDARQLARQPTVPTPTELEAQVRALYADQGRTLNEADLAELLDRYRKDQTQALIPADATTSKRAVWRKALHRRRRQAAVRQAFAETGKAFLRGSAKLIQGTLALVCGAGLLWGAVWAGGKLFHSMAEQEAHNQAQRQLLTQRALERTDELAQALKAPQPNPEQLYELTHRGALLLASDQVMLQRRNADGRYRVLVEPQETGCTALLRHFQLHPEDILPLHLTVNDRPIQAPSDLNQLVCGYHGRGDYRTSVGVVILGPSEGTP